ncbi:hypothetical protein [Desulfuromonas thiophila]|uniref:hypothetical protein n=1 Tax=Desulfuromonas thiophila TaxID=57664 RepID=UPI0024A7FD46|nr:hypothetical protein [Desulfuromonas thiophila]
MATDAQVNEIYRYTVGLFKAAPGAYLGNLEAFVDAGNSTQDMALALASSDIFTGLTSGYSPAVSNSIFATTFINNLVGTTLDAATKQLAIDGTVDLIANQGYSRAQAVVAVIDLLAEVPADDATFGAARQQFDARIERAAAYTENPMYSQEMLSSDITFLQSIVEQGGVTFNIDDTVPSIMRITGDQAVRIDFTNPANQVKGLDINGDGVIKADGIENTISGVAANFTIVDAYSRNPDNHYDNVNNYLGNISFDGTGYAGDGVNTDGNLFLGGLGTDVAYGGIGNDFLAGGGDVNGAGDTLFGGRNADFFFVELSALDPTDGNGSTYSGGETTDDSAAGLAVANSGWNSQNNDWILVEASDDDEPVTINLAVGTLTTDSGAAATINEIESVDASGNLYGFLNDIEVEVGARAIDLRATDAVAGTENYGVGSTAQLNVTGSAAANVIIGGYDNDAVAAGAGADIVFGGNLKYLLAYQNNPNLLDANGGLDLNVTAVGTVNDGTDNLAGDAGNDHIVFEMDGGTVAGGVDTGTTSGDTAKVTGDTLWLTEFSMGRLAGATQADEATAQADALEALTSDSVIRFELGNDGAVNFQNYGGTTDLNNPSQEVTNYAAGMDAVTVSGMESVIATGLGGIDFKSAGSNSPDLSFSNQQNILALEADLDLRGSAVDNTLYANTGADVLEGRGGDDNLSGGTNDDVFVFALGDGVDTVHRQVDANGDNLWDGTFGQDFRAPQQGDLTSSRLVIDFGATDLTSEDVQVALFNLKIGGETFSVDYDDLIATDSITELAALVNTTYNQADAALSAAAVGNTIIITDTEGRDISDTVAEGYGVGVILGSATASTTPTFYAGGEEINVVEDDILVIKTYDNRAINLGTNETITEITNAAALVARFDDDGSQLANNQTELIKLVNINEGDTITVTINGKDYSYTAVAGDTSELASAALVAAINNELDLNSASGRITAANNAEVAEFDEADTTAGIQDASADNAVFSITQTAVAGSQTFMDISVAVTNAVTGSAAGTASLHNQSGTFIDLVGFDGRDGALNADDVLFLGRSENSVSILQTAANEGGVLTGSDATLDGNTARTWINGDDLLYGGEGDDTINAGTGDDEIIMSAGTDTVDGGANVRDLADGGVAGETFADILQAEEYLFGEGTRFTVTLDDTLGENGAGTVEALSEAGASLGETTFTDIEVVRVLENSRESKLDIADLSDNLATAIGNNVSAGLGEGIVVNLTRVAPSVAYTADMNNDGDVADAADYNGFLATQVYGAEHVVGGNANETVNIDESQLRANNQIDLNGDQDNTTTFVEGADVVAYDHLTGGLLTVATIPTMTVAVGAGDTDTVAMTGGVLGSSSYTDTLVDVETLDLTQAITANADADTLDVSAISGAVVNYSGAQAVLKTAGGANTLTSVANIEANTLEAGGVSAMASLGAELVEITAIEGLEVVTGSTSGDVVILSDDMNGAGSTFTNTNAAPEETAVGFATYLGTAAYTMENNGLFKFNLGDGIDTLDYQDDTDAVAVSVDTTGTTSVDYVLSDVNGANDRVDVATNVERYFGGSGVNHIDLVRSAVDTTIQFSVYADSNTPSNEIADYLGANAATDTDLVVGNNVYGTADNALFATFLDRTAANANAAGQFWTVVDGNDLVQTVVLTDDQTAAAHTFNLEGGADVVNYTERTAALVLAVGANDAVTVGYQQVTIDGDTINVKTADYSDGEKTLTVVGSGENSDQVDISALVVASDTYNLVDLAQGIVVEDVLDTADGQGNVIHFSAFENVLGSAGVDRIYGNGSANVIDAGAGNDWIQGGAGTGALAGDNLTGGLGADRFIYTSDADSPTATPLAQDVITDFATTTDFLVFTTTDSGAVKNSAAASTFANAAGVVTVTIDQNASGVIGDVAADDDYTLADTSATLADTDVLLRVNQSTGQDIQYLNKVFGAVDVMTEIVYTSASQSNNLALPDELHALELDNVTAGNDKIDLRAFNFDAITAGDSVNGDLGVIDTDRDDDGVADMIQEIIFNTPATVNSLTSVDNFFRVGAVATGIQRAVHVQLESGTDNLRVFVDADMDGNYNQATDLVFDLRDVTDAGTLVSAVVGFDVDNLQNDSDANGVIDVGGDNGIFIFNDAQYGLWA